MKTLIKRNARFSTLVIASFLLLLASNSYAEDSCESQPVCGGFGGIMCADGYVCVDGAAFLADGFAYCVDVTVAEDDGGFDLAVLVAAERLDVAPINGDFTEAFRNFRNARDHGDFTVTDLEGYWEEATPAGRIYLAMLIYHINYGFDLFRELQNDHALLLLSDTCSEHVTTVAEAITEFLNTGDFGPSPRWTFPEPTDVPSILAPEAEATSY